MANSSAARRLDRGVSDVQVVKYDATPLGYRRLARALKAVMKDHGYVQESDPEKLDVARLADAAKVSSGVIYCVLRAQYADGFGPMASTLNRIARPLGGSVIWSFE